MLASTLNTSYHIRLDIAPTLVMLSINQVDHSTTKFHKGKIIMEHSINTYMYSTFDTSIYYQNSQIIKVDKLSKHAKYHDTIIILSS